MSLKEKAHNAFDKLSGGGESSSKTTNSSTDSSPNSSANKENNHADDTASNKSKQNTPPKENTAGSTPPHNTNSTINQTSPQGNLVKAQENLQALKSASPLEHAKAEMQMLTAEKAAGLNQALASGQITPIEYKQKMAGVNNLMTKLNGGGEIGEVDTQKAGITPKELLSAGMSTKTVATGSGKSFQALDMDKSGETIKTASVHSAESAVQTAERGAVKATRMEEIQNKVKNAFGGVKDYVAQSEVGKTVSHAADAVSGKVGAAMEAAEHAVKVTPKATMAWPILLIVLLRAIMLGLLCRLRNHWYA